MSTDKPVGAMLITEHEAGQIGRTNASWRTPAIFIHGLWLLSNSWDRWADLFETAAGLRAEVSVGGARQPR